MLAVLPAGAIFTEDQRGGALELAFKHAVFSVNRDPELLPGTALEHDIRFVHRDDSFHTAKKGGSVCRAPSPLSLFLAESDA